MAVATGWRGKITVRTSDTTDETVAEMGSWSISGPTRNLVEVSAFGDTIARQELGTLTGQTITFDGFYDGTDTGQNALISVLSSNASINVSSAVKFGASFPCRLKLWANGDSDLPGFGWWELSSDGSTAYIYLTGMELGQSKDGLGTISFTGAVSGDDMKWSTST